MGSLLWGIVTSLGVTAGIGVIQRWGWPYITRMLTTMGKSSRFGIWFAEKLSTSRAARLLTTSAAVAGVSAGVYFAAQKVLEYTAMGSMPRLNQSGHTVIQDVDVMYIFGWFCYGTGIDVVLQVLFGCGSYILTIRIYAALTRAFQRMAGLSYGVSGGAGGVPSKGMTGNY